MIRLIYCLACTAAFLFVAHTTWADRSFQDEFELSVLIGRSELTPEQYAELTKEIHPVLRMLNDVNTAPLVRLFGRLPDSAHQTLLQESYLKWDYDDLDEARQKVFRDMVQINIDMTREHRRRPIKGFSIEALGRSQVGFVVVAIPKTDIRYASLFILWPELEIPTWVTLVNVEVVGTPAYFDEHGKRLAEVRELPRTALPE